MPWRGKGMTLIEVVAAVAILGTVLVGIVLAQSRHTRQRSMAARQAVAVQVADAMLSAWWASPDGVPRDAGGGVDGYPGLHWRTRVVAHDGIAPLGGEVLRFTMWDSAARHNARPAARENDEAEEPNALVVVELVVPTDDRSADGGGG